MTIAVDPALPVVRDAIATVGAAMLLSATVDAIVEPAPARPERARDGDGESAPAKLERHVLTTVQWSAAALTAAALVWFVTDLRGPGLLVVFSAFVVYLLAWWARLQAWRRPA